MHAQVSVRVMTALDCNQGDKAQEDHRCDSENYSECEHVTQLSTREAAGRVLSVKQVRLCFNHTLFQSSASFSRLCAFMHLGAQKLSLFLSCFEVRPNPLQRVCLQRVLFFGVNVR
jgi:hypothetical protein